MTAPDLEALEKLADEASAPMPGRKRLSWFRRQTAFKDAANPATIKALIAELRAGREAVEELLYAHTDKSIAMGEAFLARNGKGEGQ